jgi:hypothetical protein
MVAAPFVWGPGGSQLTPEEIAKMRAFEDEQMAGAIDTSPVGHWTQGLARVANAAAGAYRRHKLGKASEENASYNSGLMKDLFGSSEFPAAPSAGGTAASASGSMPPDLVENVMAAAPQGGGTGGGEWLRYANQGAVRSQPLNEKLVNALRFLPELGVSMEVFSGGQPGKGEKGGRVGSTRHDHGHAADVFFMKDGRKLDWANPDDLPIFQEIVRRGKANGVTGFGAGEGYMRPGSMHIGFGSPSVWGAGGKGANAPDWLRQAYAGGGQPLPAAQAVTAMAQGGQQIPAAPSVMAPQGEVPQQSQAAAMASYIRQNMVDGAAEPGKAGIPVAQAGGQQAMQQVASVSQPPVLDPVAYNAQTMRMSPDLAGLDVDAVDPINSAPRGQPPIPGIQPTGPTMQDMAGRMPAPTGQPMTQGMEGLASALQQPQAAPPLAPPVDVQQMQVAQAAPQQQPSVDPRALAQAIRNRGGNPDAGILPTLMGEAGQQNLAQMQPSGPNPQALLQVMADPRATDQTKRIAQILYTQQQAQQQAERERQMKMSDPAYQMGLEKSRLELDQMRNPVPKAPSLVDIYDEKTGQPYKAKWNAETGQFERVGGIKVPTNGMSLRTNPDGTVEFVQGTAANKPFTEGQSKDNVFSTRARGALPTLDKFADNLTSLGNRVLDSDPTGILRGKLQDSDYQVAKAAGDEFLQAILRKDTGAAITVPEQQLYGVTYLPQPGDGPEVRAYKKEARQRAIAAIESGMSPAQMVAQEKALAAAAGVVPPPSEDAPPTQGARPRATNPETGEVVEFDGEKWVPVQ